MSKEKVKNWFKLHRAELKQHIADKNPSSEPPELWWVYFISMDYFTKVVEKTFRRIQGLTTIIQQQIAALDHLSAELVEVI